MTMALRDCVEIEAYDASKRLVHRELWSTYQWYEDLHPIIDTDEERARLKVWAIQGKQYDDQGNLVRFWQATYAPDGALIEDRVWKPSDPIESM
jgi:hypothetical protein